MREPLQASRERPTMQEQTDQLKKLRLAIIIANIVGLLSFFSMKITIFAYGDDVWFSGY